MIRLTTALIVSLLASCWADTGFACGSDSDCNVEGGSYRVHLPPAFSGNRPGAIVYFHGYQQTARDAMEDKDLIAVSDRLGVALVAPNGEGKTWSFPSSPFHLRDDFAFVHQVIDDVVRRFSIDRRRMIGAGFSQGASMTWYLACREPRLFAAFASVSGDFWRPVPRRCADPVPMLLHLHGTSDKTFPMEGREISPGIHQATVGGSFAVLGKSAPLLPSLNWRLETGGGTTVNLACERIAPQEDSAFLEFCRHPGGHVFFAGWVEHAWLEADRAGRFNAAGGAIDHSGR